MDKVREVKSVESAPDARWKEILREEAQKMARATKSEALSHKDLGTIEGDLLANAKELFKRALERYQQEQTEAQL